MGSVGSIDKCYKDVCCPKDFKLSNSNQGENSLIKEEFENNIISNQSFNNDNENINNKNNRIFMFENDEYNYNNDDKIEQHEIKNCKMENNKLFDNIFKNEMEIINEENNIYNSSRKSGLNSLNFSFKGISKNSRKNNVDIKNKKKLNGSSLNPNNKNNNNKYNISNYYLSQIIKIQRIYRLYINRKKISEKKTSSHEENEKDKNQINNQDNKLNIHLNAITIELSRCYSSLLLNRYLTDIDFINVNEESFRSFTMKSNKLQELELPQFCTLRDLDNDQIKGHFLLKKKLFKYQGQKDEEGKKIGFGLIFWEDSSKLKGYFINSKLNGYVYFYNCGNVKSTFLGEYKDNIPNGYGIYSRKGYTLEGSKWNKNNLNDIGVSIWEEGEMYEGELKNSVKDGIGLYRWSDGTSYIGQFKNNKLNGYGKMNFTNGNIYEGEFNEGFLSGWGKFIWDDGKYYIGNYLKDKKHGFGIFVWNLEPLIALIGFWNQGKQSGVCVKLFKGVCKIVFISESKNIIEINSRYEISKYLLPSQSKYKNFFKKKYNEFAKFINYASK